MIDTNQLLRRASALHIHSVAANWQTIIKNPEHEKLLQMLIEWEETERNRRKLELLVKRNGVIDLDPIANFDWSWPKKIDREQVEDLFSLSFIEEKVNVVLIGSAGLGKTMIAKNLVDLASRKGLPSLFIESSKLMGELVPETTRRGLEAALAKYTKPKLLAIDELGYLAYDTRFADLLFQLIQRRAKNSSTIITTNRAFYEWNDVFPNAASVTALIDRIVERCEVIKIEGDSFRQKRFLERQKKKTKKPSKAAAPQAQPKGTEPVLPK
jgi:DNA replication protein DnaC